MVCERICQSALDEIFSPRISLESGPGIFSELGPSCHRSRRNLVLQFWRTLQRQAAQIAADDAARPERDQRYKEQSEPPLRIEGSLHRRPCALGARTLNLSNRLTFAPHTKQEEHVPSPFHTALAKICQRLAFEYGIDSSTTVTAGVRRESTFAYFSQRKLEMGLPARCKMRVPWGSIRNCDGKRRIE